MRQASKWSGVAHDQAVLTTLAVEWPVFLLLAAYLDAVLDTKHGLPKHPLFFLGYTYGAGEEAAAPGGAAEAADEAEAAEKGQGMGESMLRDVVVEVCVCVCACVCVCVYIYI